MVTYAYDSQPLLILVNLCPAPDTRVAKAAKHKRCRHNYLPGVAIEEQLIADKRLDNIKSLPILRHLKFWNGNVRCDRPVNDTFDVAASIFWFIEYFIDFLLGIEVRLKLKAFGQLLRLFSPSWNSARE